MPIDFLLETEGETLKLRLLVLLVAVLGLDLYKAQVLLAPIFVLCAAYLIYSLLLRSFIIPKLGGAYLVYVMILIDTATIMAGLHLSGGLNTVFFALIPIFIVYYAAYLAYNSALAAATTMSLAYVGLAAFEGRLATSVPLIATQVFLCYLLALFSGYLGNRSIMERAERMALQQTLQAETGTKALLEVSKELYRNLNLSTILANIVQAAPRLIGLSRCVVALWDTDSDQLVGAAANVTPEELGVGGLDELVDRAEGRSVVALALDEGAPVLAEGADLPLWAAPLRPATFVAVPLTAGTTPIGMMYLFEEQGGRGLNGRKLQLTQSFAKMAAMAIANARVYESAQAQIGQLVGRLRAAIQRSQRQRVLEVGGFHIDLLHRQATLAGQPLDLSFTEFALLRLLAERAGQPVSHEAIYGGVWGGVYDHRSNVVNVCVHRLRQKVEADPASPRRIITVRGAGYMLADGSSDESSLTKGDEPSRSSNGIPLRRESSSKVSKKPLTGMS